MRVPGLLFEEMEIYPDMRVINQFTVVQVLRPVQLSQAKGLGAVLCFLSWPCLFRQTVGSECSLLALTVVTFLSSSKFSWVA